MEDFLTKEVRKSRLHEVQAHQLKIQQKLRQEMVGKTYRVLIEGSNSMKGEVKLKGRTNCNRIIHFKPMMNDHLIERNLKWHWVDVKCTSATALSCQGELLEIYGRRLH